MQSAIAIPAVNSSYGLTTEDVSKRLARFGPSEPARRQRTRTVAQLLLLFANPLVIILLAASIISALLGQTLNASIIVLMVLLSVTLNFVQTYRSAKGGRSHSPGNRADAVNGALTQLMRNAAQGARKFSH